MLYAVSDIGLPLTGHFGFAFCAYYQSLAFYYRAALNADAV